MPKEISKRINEEVLDDEPRSIILSMISQLSTNMDLSKVTLPTFVLEPRSFTERITDFMTHPNFLIDSNNESDPLERFIIIVKYYMSGWHIQPVGVKKPYNPIIGEFFRCRYNLSNNVKAYFVSEQVSHHPPITAFAYYCPDENIFIEGDLRPKGRFLGNSVGVFLSGSSRVLFKDHDEEYIVTYPNLYARGILFGKMVLEIGEKSTIVCAKNDLVYKVEFKTKGIFGGQYNQVAGKVKHISKDDTVCEISGFWDTVMNIRRRDIPNSRETVFFDSESEVITPPTVAEIEDQEDLESRRLWNETTKGIQNKDLDHATAEKTKIEDRQREESKKRLEKNETWSPRFFVYGEDSKYHPLLSFKDMSRENAEESNSKIEEFIFSKPA